MARRAPVDEREIIPAFLRGDPEAVGVIDSWIDTVLRSEFRSMQRGWDDLKQDVRLRVVSCLRAGRFNGDAALRTYVQRIARYTCIDGVRKAARRRETEIDGSASELESRQTSDEGARLAERDLLAHLLAGLSARDRDVVDLVFGQHLSHAEVGLRLGLKDGAVRSLVARVRERLLRRSERLLAPPGDEA